jgi:DNA polymerase-3 subunit gamma/tau
LSSGKRPLVFSNDLISYFRDLLLIFSLKEKAREIVVVKDDIFEQMKAQAVQENYAEILKAIEVLSGVEQELRYSAQPRIVLETAVIKIINEASLERRVEKLEEIVKNFPR